MRAEKSAGELVAEIAAATSRDRALIAAYEGRTMEASGGQLDTLLDAARALTQAGIEFALIGGFAVGIRSGSPRATNDVDFAITTKVAVDSAVSALESAGFSVTGRVEHSVNLRHPSGEPVQLSFDSSLDPMIERAEAVDVGGAAVPVVTTHDLIASKERAASDPSRRRSKALRDRADIELLRGDVPDPDEGW